MTQGSSKVARVEHGDRQGRHYHTRKRAEAAYRSGDPGGRHAQPRTRLLPSTFEKPWIMTNQGLTFP